MADCSRMAPARRALSIDRPPRLRRRAATLGARSPAGPPCSARPPDLRGQQADRRALAVDEVNASGALGARRRLVLDVRDDGRRRAGRPRCSGSSSTAAPSRSSAPRSPASALPPTGSPRRAASRWWVSNTGDGVLEIGDFIFRVALSERAVQPVTVAVTTAACATAGPRSCGRAATRTPGGPRRLPASRCASCRRADRGRPLVRPDRRADTGPRCATSRATARRAVHRRAGARRDRAHDVARRTPALRDVPFIGGDAFNAPGLMAQAGGVGEGAISGAAWIAAEDTPGNAAFVRPSGRAAATSPTSSPPRPTPA